MKKQLPAESVSAFDRDVEDTPVTALLTQQLHDPHWQASVAARWAELQESHENIARFIALASLNASPDNPNIRQLIAQQMVGLVMLLEEDLTQRDINKSWAAEGQPDQLNPAERAPTIVDAAA